MHMGMIAYIDRLTLRGGCSASHSHRLRKMPTVPHLTVAGIRDPMNDLIDDLLIIVFLATMYSTLCVFIPLRPFRNRLHAMKWLLVTFFTLMLMSGLITLFSDAEETGDPSDAEEVSDGG